MSKKKVVVAFSGGLDTSFTVMYLAREKGYEVYAACANTGGFSEEQLKQNEENAYKLGAVKYVTLDVTKEYYEKSLKYMIYGNVLRNCPLRKRDWRRSYCSRLDRCRQRPDSFRHDILGACSQCRDYHTHT